MIVMVKTIWKCLTSPTLYKVYRDGALDSMYKPQGAEKWGDKIISSANTILNITLYTSPLICMYMYKRGFVSLEECRVLMNYFGSVSCFIAFAFLLRAYGRATSPKYMEFIRTLEETPDQTSEAYIAAVRRYDFDFTAWPVSYIMPPKSSPSWFSFNPFQTKTNADLPSYQRVAVQFLAYIATHTFALRLIYPGSLGVIHSLMWTPLMLGRTHLVETYNGQRAKIKTPEGNSIDTMFVDNRGKYPKGRTLVICCEGNSGFYEVGIMTSPIRNGYSAFGWNHPGFAESSGLPYPSQEHNAIDSVLQYAINKLNFKPEDIVMFGWSIGGYSAAWAAVNYPIKGLVLDATFDDLLPLAERQMPASWARLVKEVVGSYVQLDVAALLARYQGPLHLVRRTSDEIICLEPGKLSSNRGNHLLLRILEQRYPALVASKREELERYTNMPASKRPTLDSLRLSDDPESITHVSMYMSDYKSTHCTPLPDEFFASVMDKLFNKKND